MQPLNPFLAAFFKSTLPAQCTPVQNHVCIRSPARELTRQILLVPATDVLLTSRDRETGEHFADLAHSEDFLGSHVLRIQSNASAAAGGKDSPNMREIRGKPRQYTTINGRTVVIKDHFAYSNKGFKTLNQAQLLNDAIWYPDTLEPRQWLIYYISRPLLGQLEEVKIPQAILPMPRRSDISNGDTNGSLPKKKDIKTFGDLLSNFPMIARQMQPGLEKLLKEFMSEFQKPLPPPPSANVIPDPTPDGPIASAIKKARSNSIASRSSAQSNGSARGHSAFTEDEEYVMRSALETAVTNAIDLFQTVDKQQLSLLGATTDLTGPVVERLIERYVAEQVHSTILYPRLVTLKRAEDLDLESKIRQMEFIDVSQVGISAQGGKRGKRELMRHLNLAVEEFRKLASATSPQEMLDILVVTLRTVSQIGEVPVANPSSSEKSTVLAISADTLVSLLMLVVIRAQVRHLLVRLTYMRHFIFVDDVESGEMGYALSTLEGVLSYLAMDAADLRKASRRNKKLWQATAKGDTHEMMNILEPDRDSDSEISEPPVPEVSFRPSRQTSFSASLASLNHVFPFQIDNEPEPFHMRRPKMVTMDTRSMSSSSEISFRSRATTLDSMTSAIEGDLSIERLAQTEDILGQSIVMMAIQNERPEALKYLLSLSYFPLEVVLEDSDTEGTTLFAAAVQLGHAAIIEIIWDFIHESREVLEYLRRQDTRGRSAAHYLFNAPMLITRLGSFLPWTQKDKNGQTPLFALCRSYDQTNYREMVTAGLEAASAAQSDGQPLHVDEHVDVKGNTLLHIVNDAVLASRILSTCDVDVNATNDKKFTALMVASKYGRVGMVRALFADPRVDIYAKELRGLTAIELAKDDDVRNRIDDLVLFSTTAGDDGRVTGVVRSFFVEDATIRLVLKSGEPSKDQHYIVTTCRRSLSDFEHLARLLGLEHPASWLPSVTGMRSPFQIPSKPSRAILRDTQLRLDSFLKVLLAHSTFSTHEMLWEFFLVPEIQADLMEQRSKLKADTRMEKVRDELEPLDNVRDVERFVDFARDMVRSVNHSTKSVARRSNALHAVSMNLYDASSLFVGALSNVVFLPESHVRAFEAYVQTLSPSSAHPYAVFHSNILSIHRTVIAMLLALSRPTSLISSITAYKKSIDRSYSSISRSTRWPLGILDETRQRLNEEKEEKARKATEEKTLVAKELRYSQQVVASELAGWQDLHARMGRQALRELARSMLTKEKATLDGLQRAVRRLNRGE